MFKQNEKLAQYQLYHLFLHISNYVCQAKLSKTFFDGLPKIQKDKEGLYFLLFPEKNFQKQKKLLKKNIKQNDLLLKTITKKNFVLYKNINFNVASSKEGLETLWFFFCLYFLYYNQQVNKKTKEEFLYFLQEFSFNLTFLKEKYSYDKFLTFEGSTKEIFRVLGWKNSSESIERLKKHLNVLVTTAIKTTFSIGSLTMERVSPLLSNA